MIVQNLAVKSSG